MDNSKTGLFIREMRKEKKYDPERPGITAEYNRQGSFKMGERLVRSGHIPA